MHIRTIFRTTGISAVAAVAAAGVLLSGCSSGGGGGGSAAAASQQPVAVGLTSAEEVASTLERSVSTMTTTVVYTAASDPDHLLGTAHGYLSKVAFSDSRVQPADVEGARAGAVVRGGSVETFATPAQAHARARSIESGAEGTVSAGEYHYYVGGSLIRVSQVLTSAQAEDYQLAAQSLD
ncbi:hypothetical protein RVR_4226 [Actinacidiphila reveromycinica]|uniref:Lipoprotein n=1 Tax=Actinacidiphila reveromycinica TaxID=659352 RepID=A0A7U3UT14_9ACTN|nr:hypothetical protein [Streptomyces sp. SN-593]BBA98151.1 hypothetical protein RVR_4226 [Streptomyces sp. SN-593]